MSVAEDFLLVVTDPHSGKPLTGWAYTDLILGGAILFDLVTAGRLDLDGQGRKARVVVINPAQVEDPVLEAAFARIRHGGPQSPQRVVAKLGKHAMRNLYASLAAKGAVRPRGEKAFSRTRHDVLGTARRDDLLNRVRASLLHDQPADAYSGPLIGLMSAANLTSRFVAKADRKRAKDRAKVISQGDWASEALRKAIQAAQSAVIVAISAGTISGTVGTG